MKIKLLLVATLAFSACGKKSSKPPEPNCKNAIKGMTEGFTRMGTGDLDPMIKKVIDVLAAKCEAKQWPPGMIECYTAAIGDDAKPEEISKAEHCQMANAAFINEASEEASKK